MSTFEPRECFWCGGPIYGIVCQQCNCERCGDKLQNEFFPTCNSGAGNSFAYDLNPNSFNDSQNFSDLPTHSEPISVHPTCNSGDENSFTYDSKPNSVDDSPNVFNPPPQPSMYSCEFCRNDARYGHYCTPQVPFIYPKPCYNQDFNFPQDFHDFQQQYLCCENCGGPHETFQCQPMNEDYYEQNSCYDPNSFGFDQFQPL
ncbi:hypothetical protein Tco_0491352 [Tanacetum coccineum]